MFFKSTRKCPYTNTWEIDLKLVYFDYDFIVNSETIDQILNTYITWNYLVKLIKSWIHM